MRRETAISSADEFLAAEVQAIHGADAARIDHRIGIDPFAPVEDDGRRANRDDPTTELILLGTEDSPRSRIERGRLDTVVADRDRPLPTRKANFMIGPMRRLDVRNDPAISLCDIGVEKRPDMIAAEALAFLNEDEFNVWAPPRKRQSGKAARKAAASDDQARQVAILRERVASAAIA